jgi:mannose-6-phosphate isomerase-like protein (cupin superfamily)
MHLPHVVEKPWGREIWWALTERYCGKRIDIRAGESMSLQYHERKHETIYVMEGRLLLRLGDHATEVGPGFRTEVPPGTIHRLSALTDAVLMEVSTPEVDDVVRLEDRYGRTTTVPASSEMG